MIVWMNLKRNLTMFKPINTSPKYPVDAYFNGPHFLAKDNDGYLREMWWGFPHPGSTSYEENKPPSIQYTCCNSVHHPIPLEWTDLPI